MSLFRRKKTENFLVSQIKILQLQAGDIVVLTCDRPLSRIQLQQIRARLIHVLPPEVTPVILDRGLELEVIRPEPAPGC